MQITIPCAVTEEQTRLLFRDLVRQMRYFFGDVASLSQHGAAFRAWSPNPYLGSPVHEVLVEAKEGRIFISSTPGTASASPANVELLVNELEQLVSCPAHSVTRRVFGVGWQKTGTVSLGQALRSLGHLTCHFAPWILGHQHHADPAEAEINLEWIEDYGAVLDLPAAALYRELDRRFPKSLFILTIRDTEAWLGSVENHMTRGKRAFGQLASVDRWAYGCDDFDPERFRTRYEHHNRDVLTYFSGRPDFLCLDVTTRDPWQPICDLLGVPASLRPFPHLNQRPTR